MFVECVVDLPDEPAGDLYIRFLGWLRLRRPTLSGRGAAYCQGVAIPHMTVLDAAKLLADPAIVINEAI